MARMIKVIENQERVGEGTKENPMRLIYQLWTLEGQLQTYKEIYERQNTWSFDSTEDEDTSK